jgi:glycosyltransferase involved in cell wall biosynthesis
VVCQFRGRDQYSSVGGVPAFLCLHEIIDVKLCTEMDNPMRDRVRVCSPQCDGFVELDVNLPVPALPSHKKPAHVNRIDLGETCIFRKEEAGIDISNRCGSRGQSIQLYRCDCTDNKSKQCSAIRYCQDQTAWSCSTCDKRRERDQRFPAVVDLTVVNLSVPEEITRRIKVLWVMADFAIGGISSYTDQLFTCLRGYPVDFEVMYYSDLRLDVDKLSRLGCKVSQFDRDEYLKAIQTADIVSGSGISKFVEDADFIMQHAGDKYVCQIHGTCKYSRDMADLNAAYTSRFMACSPAVVEKHFRGSPEVVHPVFQPDMPLDFSRVQRRRSKADAKKRFTSCTNPLVTYAGRMSEEKNIRGIVDAVASLKHVNLLLVGTGGQWRETVLYAQGKLGKRLVLTPWTQCITDYLDATDAFIVMSPDEGGPYTLLEALAHGTPVVSTPVGISRDYRYTIPGRHEANAVFLYESPADILKAIEFNDPAATAAVQQCVAMKHNPATIAEQWMAFFRSCVQC